MACVIVAILMFAGCKKDQQGITGPNYLYATPGAVTVMKGRDTTTTISGGTPPYIILRHAKSPYAHDSLSGNNLMVYGDNQGGTSVVVGDAANPQNTLEIPVTVTTTVSSVTSTLRFLEEQHYGQESRQ